MEREFINGLMAVSMLELLKIIRGMERVFSIGLMEGSLRGNGKMGSKYLIIKSFSRATVMLIRHSDNYFYIK